MWSLTFVTLTAFRVFQVCVAYVWNDYMSVDLSGSLNILLSAPHGGNIKALTPATPDRSYGCYINGKCVWRHNCGTLNHSQ